MHGFMNVKFIIAYVGCFIRLFDKKAKAKFHPVACHEDTQGGSTGISFNLGARWGWVVNATRRSLYPRE
jgi:hypothetical protein